MVTTDNPLLGRIARRAAQIRPTQGGAFEVKENQFIQISDMLGKQTASVIVFNLHDFEEYFSPAQTRSANNALMLRKGDGLYSNRYNRMLTLIEDTVGRHDMLMPACRAERYLEDYGIPDHPNCLDNYIRAMQERGYEMPENCVPDPVHFFMHVAFKARAELDIREPLSSRNDNVILKAHMDSLVVVSACPQDQNATNAFKPTDILVRVYA